MKSYLDNPPTRWFNGSKENQGLIGTWIRLRDEHGNILGMPYKSLDMESIKQTKIEGF